MLAIISRYAKFAAQRLGILRALWSLLFGGLLLGGFLLGLTQPAYAENSQDTAQYIAADGTDLTAVAQCLPKRLSQPSLARALRESGNDFLQKVFDIKDNYMDYKLDESEVEYLNCLRQKGVTPQVESYSSR
ncbi:MAG: hypothetical protein AAF728_01905 [Cyanobacteria bacterium P01_D01_bin.128]